MRISTRDASRAKSRTPDSRPSGRQRAVAFAVGAVIGGVVGYGVLSSSPNPQVFPLSLHGALWIFAPALVLGALAALGPRALLRPSRKYRAGSED